MWKIVAGFVVTLLFVAACGGGDSDPEEPREPQVTRATVLLSPTTRITTIDTPRSDFILEFFQGAFSEDTEITIEEVPRGDQPEAIQKVGEGVAYRLGPPGLMLQSPIRVSLRPDRVDLPGDPPDGETIFAYYVAAVDEDGSGEVLDDLFMEYNADTGWIQMRGWTDRFSWIVWGRSLMHAGLEQLEPKEIAVGSSFDISYRVASRTADSGDGPLKITRADLFANGAIDIQTGTTFVPDVLSAAPPNPGFIYLVDGGPLSLTTLGGGEDREGTITVTCAVEGENSFLFTIVGEEIVVVGNVVPKPIRLILEAKAAVDCVAPSA